MTPWSYLTTRRDPFLSPTSVWVTHISYFVCSSVVRLSQYFGTTRNNRLFHVDKNVFDSRFPPGTTPTTSRVCPTFVSRTRGPRGLSEPWLTDTEFGCSLT